jgi:photosystem II stability/assembly factor-like uncharacterized protein
MGTIFELRKPTAFTDHDSNWVNEEMAYDMCEQVDTGTSQTDRTYGIMYDDSDPSLTLDTWQEKLEGPYTETRLYLIWATTSAAGNDQWGVRYTDDGGSNFYDLVPFGVNRSAHFADTQRAEVTLATANQDLTQLYIEVYTDRVGGSDNLTISIYDVWTEGDYTITPDEWLLEDRFKDEDPPQSGINAGVAMSDTTFLIGTYPQAQIWKSTDAGDTWTMKRDLNLEDPPQGRISAFCRIDSTTVLLGSQSAAQIWKSTDTGDTWTLKKDLYNENSQTTMIAQFALVKEDGASSEIVCLTQVKGQVWKSFDAGDTWTLQQQLDKGDIIGAGAGGIVALDEDIVLCSTTPLLIGETIMWKSTDGGASFVEKQDLSDEIPSQITLGRMAKLSSTSALAGSGNDAQIWKTTDSGDSYTVIVTFDDGTYSTCKDQGIANIIEVDPIDSDIILVSSGNYVLYTNDGGASRWEIIYRGYVEGDRAPAYFPQLSIGLIMFGHTAGDIALMTTANDGFIFSNTAIGTPLPAAADFSVNIGDVWKDVAEITINIGDAWKAVTELKINIGDVWKTITLP